MYLTRKLKREKFNRELLIPIIVLLPFFALIKLSGLQAAYLFLAPVLVLAGIYGFLTYRRTYNRGYLLVSVVMVLGVIMSLLVFSYGRDIPKTMIVPVIVLLLITLPVLAYMIYSKKTKWRLREMLELAAKPVEDIKKGFSERPYPVGFSDHTSIELDGFSYFLRRNLIALPIHDQDKVVFVLSQDYGFILGFDNAYLNKTYILFENDGRVLAHISKRDYLRYRDDLAYDQLCDSLGKLFIEFFDLYRRGESISIMERIDELNFNPITDN
jgi:hypothetical protein